jgi:hypothetical protein
MKAFVLMPFAPDFDDIFSSIIRAPLEAEGYEVGRADESRGTRNIMHDVIQGIASADLVIADLTGGNPNVYYELGIAHALGRRTILLTQDLEEVPFDLRAYRVVTYSTHFSRVAEATQTLRETARGAKEGSLHFGSPVSDYTATKQVALSPAAHSNEEVAATNAVAPMAPEDVGLLDCVIDVQEGMNAINTVVVQMGQRFEALTPSINLAKTKLEGSARHEPTQARLAVRELAAALDEYTRWLKPANVEYRQGLSRLASGLDNLFAIDLSGFDVPGPQLIQLYEVFDVLGGAAGGAVSMLNVLVEVVGALPRVEKEFNRAKRVFLDEMSVTRDSLQQTQAVLLRAKDGAQRLQSSL